MTALLAWALFFDFYTPDGVAVTTHIPQNLTFEECEVAKDMVALDRWAIHPVDIIAEPGILLVRIPDGSIVATYYCVEV